MERGVRGMRRSRGGRPFIRGFYRGRTPGRKGIRRPMESRSRTSSSRDKYESSLYHHDNDRSDSHEERSWDSPSATDKDASKEKNDEDDSSPIGKAKWDKGEDNEKNDGRYLDKKDYSNDSKHYGRPTGQPYRGQRRPYQNNYWDRSDRGRHRSPQSQYRVRPYHSPRHRRYSRSPDRRRSPSRYRSRSHTPSQSRRYSSSKHRSPKRRSQSRRPRSPNEFGQSIEKNQTVKSNSNDENNSDDFVEKLKASKGSKTPGRVDYTDKDDDHYWIEADKNDTKKSNRPDYSSKGSKTPGLLELSGADNDEYWVKSQTSKPSTKNLYSSSWDDSPIQEKPVSKVPKTPGRKDYSTKDNDDYWLNSSPNESVKHHSANELYLKKTKNKDSTIMYVQELSSSDSEPEKITKRSRSVSLTNSDKSDTPPINTEQSNKLGTRYSQGSSSRGSNTVLKEPPPLSLPAAPSSLPVYNSQWSGIQNASTSSYPSTTNYVQPQASQFTDYQHRQQIPIQNSQWYQPGYQQYGTSFQQFQQYDQKSVAYNPVHSNLEQVEGYQSASQGLYNIDLKQVVDITKPPPNITPINPVSDSQPKSSRDSLFETQHEVYTTKLFTLKKELETLQIQYDTLKSDNSDGHHNIELKKNRKAQDDVNGKIKGVNNILEVLNTMVPKDSLKDIKKVEPKILAIESECVKSTIEISQQQEVLTTNKHRRHSTSSSSSVEHKKKYIKSNKSKKSNVQSSNEEKNDSNKSYKSKELIDTNKKKIRVEKLPQFNYVYCDSCIHWCQPCNIFPKTAKEYLMHLHSESHKLTLEELNVVELPWHDSPTKPLEPEKNLELPTKRVPIKGLEFFYGTSAWYCKLCDTWIGDLHCASAHFKSKRHNDLYAELIAKEPNWEIDWLTKRTRAFEKSLSQTNAIKSDVLKESKPKENSTEFKTEKSFFDKEPRKEREKDKLRDREKDRDRYTKDVIRKTSSLKNQLSPDKEGNDTNNVSISDWMKPVDLPVEKSMISLKESVQKSKDRLHKSKADEIDEYKCSTSDIYVKKKQRIEEPKPPIVYEKKDDFNLTHRNKIKLPFIGKMPFAKPVNKKTNSSAKDIPNYTVESTIDEPKDNFMDPVTIQKMLIEKMIAANEKKIEKQILPIDMDIDEDNNDDNNDTILSAGTDSLETQLNSVQPGNQMHQMYNQTHATNILPQDLNTALNMIFPCNEGSLNTSINTNVHNPLMQQHFNMSYNVTSNSNTSPERKKKKNAPSQRKRRQMKKIMGKEEESTKNEYDHDNKSKVPSIQGPKEEENIRKYSGNESEGDELAMLGIDAEDMAAQYY